MQTTNSSTSDLDAELKILEQRLQEIHVLDESDRTALKKSIDSRIKQIKKQKKQSKLQQVLIASGKQTQFITIEKFTFQDARFELAYISQQMHSKKKTLQFKIGQFFKPAYCDVKTPGLYKIFNYHMLQMNPLIIQRSSKNTVPTTAKHATMTVQEICKDLNIPMSDDLFVIGRADPACHGKFQLQAGCSFRKVIEPQARIAQNPQIFAHIEHDANRDNETLFELESIGGEDSMEGTVSYVNDKPVQISMTLFLDNGAISTPRNLIHLEGKFEPHKEYGLMIKGEWWQYNNEVAFGDDENDENQQMLEPLHAKSKRSKIEDRGAFEMIVLQCTTL